MAVERFKNAWFEGINWHWFQKTIQCYHHLETANLDALAAHARDEIGITETSAAQPMQAALASAASFCAGAILPLLVALTASSAIVPALAVSTLCGLAGLGYISAKLGGAPVIPAVLRVCLWGVAALVITGFIGKLAGVAVWL